MSTDAARTDDDANKFEQLERMYARYKASLAVFEEVLIEDLLQQSTKGPILLVDCRMSNEQAVSMLPGSITQTAFDALLSNLTAENPATSKDLLGMSELLAAHTGTDALRIVCYCTIGYRSGTAATCYASMGLAASNMTYSALGWTHADLPLAEPPAGMLDAHQSCCWMPWLCVQSRCCLAEAPSSPGPDLVRARLRVPAPTTRRMDQHGSDEGQGEPSTAASAAKPDPSTQVADNDKLPSTASPSVDKQAAAARGVLEVDMLVPPAWTTPIPQSESPGPSASRGVGAAQEGGDGQVHAGRGSASRGVGAAQEGGDGQVHAGGGSGPGSSEDVPSRTPPSSPSKASSSASSGGAGPAHSPQIARTLALPVVQFRPTRRLHVLASKWALQPAGYEAVTLLG